MPMDIKHSELRKKRLEQKLAISKRLNPNLSEQEANKKYGKMTMEELSALPCDTIRLISMVKTEKGHSMGCASKLALRAQHILWKMAGSQYGRSHGGKGMEDSIVSFIPKSSLQSPVCSYYDYTEELSKKLDALNRELDLDLDGTHETDSDDDGARKNIMESNMTSASKDMDLLKEEYEEELVY